MDTVGEVGIIPVYTLQLSLNDISSTAISPACPVPRVASITTCEKFHTIIL